MGKTVLGDNFLWKRKQHFSHINPLQMGTSECLTRHARGLGYGPPVDISYVGCIFLNFRQYKSYMDFGIFEPPGTLHHKYKLGLKVT